MHRLSNAFLFQWNFNIYSRYSTLRKWLVIHVHRSKYSDFVAVVAGNKYIKRGKDLNARFIVKSITEIFNEKNQITSEVSAARMDGIQRSSNKTRKENVRESYLTIITSVINQHKGTIIWWVVNEVNLKCPHYHFVVLYLNESKWIKIMSNVSQTMFHSLPLSLSLLVRWRIETLCAKNDSM